MAPPSSRRPSLFSFLRRLIVCLHRAVALPTGSWFFFCGPAGNTSKRRDIIDYFFTNAKFAIATKGDKTTIALGRFKDCAHNCMRL